MNDLVKQYADRDPEALDVAGNYYIRHVSAMTGESLHSKAAIAAELGYRDMRLDQLANQVETLQKALRVADSLIDRAGLIECPWYRDEIAKVKDALDEIEDK